jgi:hypothetical protein
MRVRTAVPLTLLAVLGCGDDRYDPLSITGGVKLLTWGSAGESAVQAFAYVSRLLPDGGSDLIVDAGVALNGVPLGPSDPDTPYGGGQSWLRLGLDGATYGAQQTLSVIGANPPASVSFTCPEKVLFTAPEDGARLDRSVPVAVAWTDGGSPGWVQILLFAMIQPLEDGSTDEVFAFTPLDAGARSFPFEFPAEYLSVPLEATASFWMDVPGDSVSDDGRCSSVPRVDVVYAPGQPPPGG